MSIDIQWFIYALVSNGVLTPEDAVAVYSSLGDGVSLESYAQAILELMTAECDEEGSNEVLAQIQSVCDYAVSQAATGTLPPMELSGDAEAPGAVESAPEEVPAAAPVSPRNVSRQGAPPPRRGPEPPAFPGRRPAELKCR